MISLTTVLSSELLFKNGYFIVNNLITTFTYLKNLHHYDCELNDLIAENDIIDDIKIIKSFLEEIENKNHSKTVSLCIQNLAENLKNIEQTLSVITKKIEQHKHLWFNSFRSYDIQKEKIIFPKLINQMNHRFEVLRMMTSVLN